MNKPPPRPSDKKSSWDSKKKRRAGKSQATETDPLLPSYRATSLTEAQGIRARRKSPTALYSGRDATPMDNRGVTPVTEFGSETSSIDHHAYMGRPSTVPLSSTGRSSAYESVLPVSSGDSVTPTSPLHHDPAIYSPAAVSPTSRRSDLGTNDHPPLLEIPEEVYAVRKKALEVLKPLTKTWLIVTVGFALTVLFGMARWTRLLHELPFWFILLPSWFAHVGLFWCHVTSARALSTFIAEANESRQRPDSRDHLDRTEYLPLLQRSLKFGLKTGLLSFCIFLFEILIYIRIARGTGHLTVAFLPLWLLVTGGILDGIICKSQHFLRVICWMLTFCAMVLTVMKVDYGYDNIRWRVVVSPVVAVLSICSGTLFYIVYGHQVGYYRLTESQLTAGNLYSLAALICIVLVVVIGEVIPLARPVEIETRLFVVVMAPLVVCLVGMGAWVVSRDEFGRLLLYGGQAAVHPMKLRWEAQGWTSVQSKGVTIIPMFGEVSFRPLGKNSGGVFEMCACCTTCYPREDDEEETAQYIEDLGNHPYLAPGVGEPRFSYT